MKFLFQDIYDTMSEDNEVVCLTNPFKPIQPGVIKMERSDDVQVLLHCTV